MSAGEQPIRVAVCTGSRAEFGLLEPVMRAIDGQPGLELLVFVAGAHLLPPKETWREVERAFPISATIPMQEAGASSRRADAAALGKGASGFADAIREHAPDWIVVLGDRIEAFAAAATASVGGTAVAHLHGGDVAEGVADEAMRHAISKLAHLHLPATEASAARIVRMGEDPQRVQIVGSPAIDALARIEPMSDRAHAALGAPDALFLMHPVGRSRKREVRDAAAALRALEQADRRVLALHPNHDPGREGVLDAIERASVASRDHLRRRDFLALLKRMAASGGLLAGNSSAALIEAAAIGLRAVDIGPRQGGRERAGNVVHVDLPDDDDDAAAQRALRDAIKSALALAPDPAAHPFGDGRTGERVAKILAQQPRPDWAFLRKRNAY